ncbi:alpha/beta fold hydrolase [Desulfoplanes sp.]
MNQPEQFCFLSGWAGYAALFPRLGGLSHFQVPFSPFGEQKVKDTIINQVHAQTLVAWSTGAHMVLKWGGAVWDRFARVVLIAPFFDFTRCLPPRIIRSMQDRLASKGAGVLSEFYANCGVPGGVGVNFEDVCIPELVEGLDYLLESRCSLAGCADTGTDIHLVHGSKDKIVPLRAFREVCSALPQATVHRLACGHFVDEQCIIPLVESISQ